MNYESNKVSEISISFALTVKDELEEIQKLIPFLLEFKKPQDEIVVLWDENGDFKVWNYLLSIQNYLGCLIKDKFNNHFAQWKNKLFEHSECNYLYFIDADEMLHKEFFDNIYTVLEMNSGVEMFFVPRINIVENLGLSWVKKWNWFIYKEDDLIAEKEFCLEDPVDKDEYDLLEFYRLILSGSVVKGKFLTWNIKYYVPRINGFDLQSRICKNIPSIRWKNQVHEVLDGYKQHTFFPTIKEYSLMHVKSLEKQIKQNEFYSNLS